MPMPRPKSTQSKIAALNKSAPVQNINNSIGFKRYCMSAKFVEDQARKYYDAKNKDQAYVYYMRFATLVLKTLPGHPEYQRNDVEYTRLRERTQAAMDRIERLKILIVLEEQQIKDAARIAAEKASAERAAASISNISLTDDNLKILMEGPPPPPPPPSLPASAPAQTKPSSLTPMTPPPTTTMTAADTMPQSMASSSLRTAPTALALRPTSATPTMSISTLPSTQPTARYLQNREYQSTDIVLASLGKSDRHTLLFSSAQPPAAASSSVVPLGAFSSQLLPPSSSSFARPPGFASSSAENGASGASGSGSGSGFPTVSYPTIHGDSLSPLPTVELPATGSTLSPEMLPPPPPPGSNAPPPPSTSHDLCGAVSSSPPYPPSSIVTPYAAFQSYPLQQSYPPPGARPIADTLPGSFPAGFPPPPLPEASVSALPPPPALSSPLPAPSSNFPQAQSAAPPISNLTNQDAQDMPPHPYSSTNGHYPHSLSAPPPPPPPPGLDLTYPFGSISDTLGTLPPSYGHPPPPMDHFPSFAAPSSSSLPPPPHPYPPPPPPESPLAAHHAVLLEDLLAIVNPRPTAGPTLPPQPIEVGLIDPRMARADGTCCAPSLLPPPPPPPPPPPLLTEPAAAPVPGGPIEVASRLEGRLREVHVSKGLLDEFLALAKHNTTMNLESCGILAGRLLPESDQFVITTLIIPKQRGTSDTVQALNEEEIFEAQFERSLYPLGWIHTHPSQSCFLSSVDVHTQCGYQTMLEEAVAIVMAPRDPRCRCGVFRLASPDGVKLVQQCMKSGFHPHPALKSGEDLYGPSAHVLINESAKPEVIDLR